MIETHSKIETYSPSQIQNTFIENECKELVHDDKTFESKFKTTSFDLSDLSITKKLSQLIKMEKNVLKAIELTSKERKDIAKQLSFWGEKNDDDISDVSEKLGVLIHEIGELEIQYVKKCDENRPNLIKIKNIESSIQPTRQKKKKLIEEIKSLSSKKSSSRLSVLQQELVRVEAESLVAESQLSNITRVKLKSFFNFQFDAILELAEKYTLISNYGKMLLNLIDDKPMIPGEARSTYNGSEISKQILIDANNALETWSSDIKELKSNLN